MMKRVKGVAGIKEYGYTGEYEGPRITGKRKTVTVRKQTPEERNFNYFRSFVFLEHRQEIVYFLKEETIPVLLNSSNLDVAFDVADFILKNLEDYGLDEDQFIEYLEDYLLKADYDDSQDYEKFGNYVSEYIGAAEEDEIAEYVKQILQTKEQKINLSDEELVLEIAGFMKEKMEGGTPFTVALEEVFAVYQRYGKKGFPFMLSTMSGTAALYFRRSDYSKIVKRGIKEKYPCKNNGCGGMESISYMFEAKSTDEGKKEIKTCVKCGAERK